MSTETTYEPKVRPQRRVRRSRRWLWIVTSTASCLLAVLACLLVLRLIVVPVDTGKHNGKTAKEWIALLASDDISLRSEARVMLEEMGVEAVPNMGYALGDTNVQIRRGVVQILYDICEQDPRAANYFAKALKDTDYWIRWRAAKGLRRMGESAKPAVLDLASALTRDPDPRVRVACAQALEKIGKSAIVAHPALIEALSDDQLYVRQAASKAMSVISPEKR